MVRRAALERVANEAMKALSFYLRADHNEQVAKILTDPEASPNDKGVDYLTSVPFCAECPTPTPAIRRYDGLEFRLAKRAIGASYRW